MKFRQVLECGVLRRFSPTWRIGGEKQRKYLKIKAGIS
jgi:hypothetical protein